MKMKSDGTTENNIPKKKLDTPSSDVDEADEKLGRQDDMHTLEDIEMELVTIHGDVSKEVLSKHDKGNDNQQFAEFQHDVVDNNIKNGNHTDSDLDTEDNDNEGVKVEMCDNDEEIIIIKGISPPPGTIKKPLSKKEESVPPIVGRDGIMYACLLCEGEETVCGEAKAIMQHMELIHNARLYICDVCGEDFRKRNELFVHLDEHVAPKKGDLQCKVCNRIFSNSRLFRIHKRRHYPQNKAWTCEICGKRCRSKNLLDEHVNTHTGIRPYICQFCGKDFASKYILKAHVKAHEGRPRPFQCLQCNKSFLSEQNLTKHERTHWGVKEYSCHICDKEFGSVHNLEVHSIVHTNHKPFSCGQCGKVFARKSEITNHERTHTGERPYQCEMCGVTFSQQSDLQSHKRAAHYEDKRYKCEDCGKGFKVRRLLDYHVKSVHMGEKAFKCDVCHATFVYPEHLKKHRRIHTGEKPYLCEVCGKAFNNRNNRNTHRFVHSDKKLFECFVCEAGFMRKPLLYEHMHTHGHLNDTIIVNQPRLTTDDDQITVNADDKMEIAEGNQIQFTDEDGDIEDIDQIDESEGDQVLLSSNDYERIITSAALTNGETEIIQTKEGMVQFLKVRIPNNNGEEEDAWLKLVS